MVEPASHPVNVRVMSRHSRRVNLTLVSLLSAGFLCRLEPYLYGVCEWRILPGTAPHLRGEVNRPPPEGLRYPETPLTASTLGTADSSKAPPLGYCVVLGPTAPA